jgi:RNA polymerase sigma factor (sigma-70 family)
VAASRIRLALRMVWRPADAEDATQEILIRVITRLASWRGEASLLTWAYRIGVNYLLNLRRQTPPEAQAVSFDEFRAGLADELAAADYAGPDAEILSHEVRLTCTQAMLQCLERSERIAYVLGGIFELPSAEAAWILDVTPAAYRKRLERARQRIRAFMNSTCGLVNPDAFCRCARRTEKAIELGRADPRRPALASHPVSRPGRDVTEAAAQIGRLHDAAAVLRAHPDCGATRQGRCHPHAAALRSVPSPTVRGCPRPVFRSSCSTAGRPPDSRTGCSRCTPRSTARTRETTPGGCGCGGGSPGSRWPRPGMASIWWDTRAGCRYGPRRRGGRT